MAQSSTGFELAADLLDAEARTGHPLDDQLRDLAARLRRFHDMGKGDRITAAIIIEAEAAKLKLIDAEILLDIAAALRKAVVMSGDSWVDDSPEAKQWDIAKPR